MVQTLEPDLHETLRHASRAGAALPLEALAALEHSLPLKRATARLRSLAVWGRITTRSGKVRAVAAAVGRRSTCTCSAMHFLCLCRPPCRQSDTLPSTPPPHPTPHKHTSQDFIIAEGDCDAAKVYGTTVTYEPKLFFSQDGAAWVDLPSIDAATAARALKVRGTLSGDPAYQWPAPPPPAAAAAGAGAGAAAPDGGAADDADAAARRPVPEVARLRAIVDAISAHASVEPAGCRVPDGRGRLVANRLFGGGAHPPAKLEAYARRGDALTPGASLARDVRGSWAVHADGGGGGSGGSSVVALRSLVYPGYSFFFDARRLTWGGFYCGDGARNDDLVFML